MTIKASQNIWPYAWVMRGLQYQNSPRFKFYPGAIIVFTQTKFLHCCNPAGFVSELIGTE